MGMRINTVLAVAWLLITITLLLVGKYRDAMFALLIGGVIGGTTWWEWRKKKRS
jgi:hypothetical protein